nr:hypothetical protein [Tanacetum cinerariifolium]
MPCRTGPDQRPTRTEPTGTGQYRFSPVLGLAFWTNSVLGDGALGSLRALKASTHHVITMLLYPLRAIEATCALEVDTMRALDLLEVVGALGLVKVKAVVLTGKRWILKRKITYGLFVYGRCFLFHQDLYQDSHAHTILNYDSLHQSHRSCVVGLLAVIDNEFEEWARSCKLTSFWPAAATVRIPASLSVLAVLKPERLKADIARIE